MQAAGINSNKPSGIKDVTCPRARAKSRTARRVEKRIDLDDMVKFSCSLYAMAKEVWWFDFVSFLPNAQK